MEDLESPPPRPSLLSRRVLLRLLALFVGGVAWGMAVRFADSLPVDLGFVGFALKVGVGFVFVLGIALVLLFRGFEVDRVALGIGAAALGAWIGLGIGPTVAPPVTVSGTFTFMPSAPADLPASAGALTCEWAAGRWRIGALMTGPLDGLAPHALTVDLLRKTIALADGEGSRLLAVGSEALAPPADAPPWGAGDRSGTLDLQLLQVDPDSTADDPNEVRARFAWDCPAPPEG
jgi:hypothetical protein